jgi:hypothetical protein
MTAEPAEYERYFRIAWIGSKCIPYLIRFHRYPTREEANTALQNWLTNLPFGSPDDWGVYEHPADKLATVGELKRALENVPDGTPVYLEGSEWDMQWDGELEHVAATRYEPAGIRLGGK